MFDTDDEAAALGVYVAQNEHAIINALQLHAERMSADADSARASYEQGQGDQAQRKAQDATLVTNNGYRQFVNLYSQEAEKTRRIIAEIQRMLTHPDDIDDDEASDEEQVTMADETRQPRRCMWVFETSKTEHGYIPSAVTENEPGHSPMSGNGEHSEPWYWGDDLAKARKIAAEYNTRMGLTKDDVLEIVASSFAAARQ